MGMTLWGYMADDGGEEVMVEAHVAAR